MIYNTTFYSHLFYKHFKNIPEKGGLNHPKWGEVNTYL